MKLIISIYLLIFLVTGCSKNKIVNEEDYFLSYDNSEFNKKEKEQILDSLFLHFISRDNDSTTRNSIFKIASRYESLELNIKYYQTVDKVHLLALEKKDTLDIAKSFWYTGDFYKNKGVFDSAFHYYSQSEKLYRLSKKDSLSWGKTLLYKAGILYDIGIYTESEVETIKAMSIFSKVDDSWFIYRTNLQMALNLEELKEYEDALKYHFIALQQLSKLENENFPKGRINKSRISCFNNVGGLYDKMGNYSEAEKYYTRGLSFIEIDENPKLHAMLLNNYAHSKILSGNTQKADSLLFLALKIRNNIGHEQGIIASKIRLGEFYLNQKDTIQALQNIHEAYDLSVDNKSHLYILNCLDFLRENDSENKDHYTNRYIVVKDSLRDIERATKNKFARISYETEKITQKNEELLKRNTLLLLLVVAAIFIIITTIRTYDFKLKNRELRHKQKEQKSTEKIYDLLLKEKLVEEETRLQERNRISRELHDGIVNRVFTTRINLELLESNDHILKEKLVNELKKTESNIRDVSHQLYDNLFSENQDFNHLLKELISEQKNNDNTKFDIAIDKKTEWSKIPGKQKVHIYRIIQEALHNVNKYAKASKCSLFILNINDTIVIRIHDNGVGFNPQKIKRGLGFRILEERTRELQGKLKIKTELQKGTTIEIIL